ncbi:MAG: hypothetical protein H6604_03195 [Flavobacteriales bacterium]|nr:hypothetical protein [Flavobacteriales bacterium]
MLSKFFSGKLSKRPNRFTYIPRFTKESEDNQTNLKEHGFGIKFSEYDLRNRWKDAQNDSHVRSNTEINKTFIVALLVLCVIFYFLLFY